VLAEQCRDLRFRRLAQLGRAVEQHWRQDRGRHRLPFASRRRFGGDGRTADMRLAHDGQYGRDGLGCHMKRRWRTIRSETLLKDRWINLRADHCVTPTGVEISPYYVLSYPDWVHVVAITKAGCLVLVRQYRHGAGETFLELPGGAVDPADTSMEVAARRELLEETGFAARRWEMVSSLSPNPATHANRVHVLLALDAQPDRAQKLDPGEDGLTVELLTIRAVLDGLRSGLLGHAIHVSLLLLALSAAGRVDLTVR
jgi:8-oxo-dGTP pyrophosphatase MutT (NUDIX family)